MGFHLDILKSGVTCSGWLFNPFYPAAQHPRACLVWQHTGCVAIPMFRSEEYIEFHEQHLL